jgi:hypothetical protein
MRSIGAARRRVAMALGKSTPIDPSGYWNYEIGKTWNFHPPREDVRVRGRADAPVDTHFPAIAALDKLFAELPPEVKVIAIWPPQYFLRLPVADSSAARELDICKSEIRRRVAARGNGGVIDYLVDSELARNPENFMDYDHYRGNVARMIEDRIAQALTGKSN